MKMIQKYVEAIDDELEGAKNYAEKYVECKVAGNIPSAEKYREMSNDELKHAMYQHEWAVHKINELSKLYTPPVEMQEAWEKSHKEYVEKVAWIKQMLAM